MTQEKPKRALFAPETRQSVACGGCGWTGTRMTGSPVTCPRCGEFAAFQIPAHDPR